MKIAAIDLFCGVGGLTHGLERAGIEVLAGVDLDGSARFAYEANNCASFIHKDVRELTGGTLNGLYPKDSVRVLAGCAPCQPFSRYANKGGTGHGDKWYLLRSFSRLINDVRPDIVAMENVPGLASKDVFASFTECLKALGYFYEWKIVFCPDYGVPQKRRRLVLLASRLARIHLSDHLESPGTCPTVRSAIGGLNPIRSGEADPSDPVHVCARLTMRNLERIRASRPNGTWRDWDVSLRLACHMKRSGTTYPSVYGRMSWDEPSPTLTTQFYGFGNGRFGHPEQDRALSLREGALLQSFPPDYKFVPDGERPSFKRIGVHIGNAVPPELAKTIGNSIVKHINGSVEKFL